MRQVGHPRVLDVAKQSTICALVANGVSVRQAAHFVNCNPKTVRREALRNDDFRLQLDKAISEAGMQPLDTLRRAANSNWRAALCFMERLETLQLVGRNAKIITQREANHFAVDLVESIQRAVSNPSERNDLFNLLSAAMPVAMRRRWNGQARRRGLAEAMNAVVARRKAAQERVHSLSVVQTGVLPAPAPNDASTNRLTTNDNTPPAHDAAAPPPTPDP
jgi:IS30 family transposase